MSNSLDPDQACHFVCFQENCLDPGQAQRPVTPDLGPVFKGYQQMAKVADSKERANNDVNKCIIHMYWCGSWKLHSRNK